MPAIIKVVDGRTVIKVGDNSAVAVAAASLAEQYANDAGLSADSAAIAAAAVGVYTTVGAGEAATTNGQSFYVASGGDVTLYLNNAGTGDEVASLATATDIAAFASTAPGDGVDRVAGAGKTIPTRTAMKALTSAADKARPLQLTESGREGVFVWDASNLSAEVTLDTQEGIYVAPTSDATGASGAWVRQGKDIIELRWFGAVGDGTTDDTAAVTGFFAMLNANSQAVGSLGKGTFTFSSTIDLSTAARNIRGTPGGWRTGSTRVKTTLKWTGGASPMFTTATSRHYFSDFDVETNGTATDFLEMNAGSQAVYMSRVFFPDNLFTRSVIRSNGNRVGYSRFNQVSATLSAPKFIDIDGQATPNGVTPISFVECQFSGSGTGGTTPWTVLHIKDETVEQVVFDRCTLISRGGLVVVDTTDTPLSTTLDNFVLNACEVDNVEGATFRMFKLQNVRNIAVRNNTFTGDGSTTHLFDCDNSNIVDFTGNYWKSIGYVFDLDATCRISGVGPNNPDWSSTEGIHTAHSATYIGYSYASLIDLDLSSFHASEVGHVILDIGSAGAYTVAIDTTKPQNIEPGQRFDITVKNTSGGAISAPTFFSNDFKAAASVAPANGFSRTFSFRYNGTHAIETGRTASDIPN